MSEVTGWVTAAVASVVMFAILFCGPAACMISDQREATKRVSAICAGDLKTDVARAVACVMATKDAASAGK